MDIGSEIQTDEVAEQGSSEETLEGVSNVSTKRFSDISSIQLETTKVFQEFCFDSHITGIAQLPNEDIVVVVGASNGCDRYLTILDKEFKAKLSFDVWGKIQNKNVCKYKINIALFDGKRFAASISFELEQHKPMNIIHIVSVLPNVEISPEIKLKYACESIACSNNRIYCYTSDLNRSTLIACPGIEILSINGDLLKTIQLFDQVSCFCPTKDGGVVYFGSRNVHGRKIDVFRCVSENNHDVFSHDCSEKPIYAISDITGSVVGLMPSGNIVLFNPDGSQKRVLLGPNNMEATNEDIMLLRSVVRRVDLRQQDLSRQLRTVCFSNDYNTLLVVGLLCHWSKSTANITKLFKYKLQFSP